MHAYILFFIIVLVLILTLSIISRSINKKYKILYKESQTILAAMPLGIAIYDKDARQEYANASMGKICGVKDLQAHINKHNYLFDDPVIANGIKEQARRGEDIDTIVEYNLKEAAEKAYIQTDLSQIMFFDVKVRYIKDHNGVIEKYIIIVSDITQARMHELKAEMTNVIMKNIIEHLPCLLFIKDIDNDYRHVMVNNYFCSAVGVTQEQAIGKTDYEIFASKKEADRCRADDIVATNKEAVHIYEETTVFNGKPVTWQTTKVTITTTDGRHLLIAIALDITDKIKSYQQLQLAKEKAEESNRLKSAFVANMSHEIRTPLNAIVGFSRLMIDSEDKAECAEYFNIININNEHLLRLINDILDLSKIEAGMIDFKAVRFNLDALFLEAYDIFDKRIDHQQVKLIYENTPDDCMVELDKNRYMQVLSNFLTNAVKFTAHGEIRFGYKYEENSLYTYVSDTGIGIPQDKIERVFERFEKLNDFAQGTGLGMSINKSILESMGGTIGVDSVFGQGTTFWARIPIARNPITTPDHV